MDAELPPLDDDLIAILGRPNFTCIQLAECHRIGGADIKRKAEHEQAFVIHWLLGLYLKHGKGAWDKFATDELQAIKSRAMAAEKAEGGGA